jgi:gpW
MSTMTDEERLVISGRLKDAEDSYHKIMTGTQARTFVDQNGERVEFSVANAERLRAYILSMKTQLGIDLGIAGPAQIWML